MAVKVETIAELILLNHGTSIRDIGRCLGISFDESKGVGIAGIKALNDYERQVSAALEELGFELDSDGPNYVLSMATGYWGKEWAEGFPKLAPVLDITSHYVIACDEGIGICCFTPMGVCVHEGAVDALIAAAHAQGRGDEEAG